MNLGKKELSLWRSAEHPASLRLGISSSGKILPKKGQDRGSIPCISSSIMRGVYMPETITIGADPELVCYDPDRGEVANVAHSVHDRLGEFGADGHDWIAELRPKPAIHPADLTENLRISLLKGHRVLGHCNWGAGPFAYDKPLGGHIHFGSPLTDNIRPTLDGLMAPMLALLEPPEAARRRRATVFVGRGGYTNNGGIPYGLLGDIKTQPWGFEYRTPSSFIVTPGVSTSIIALAKALVYEELSGSPGRWSALSGSIRKELKFAPEDFYNCQREVFLTKLKTLWPILHNLVYFQKGMEGRPLWSSLKYLLQIIEKGGYPIAADIKTCWGITAKAATQVAGEDAQQRTTFTDQINDNPNRTSRFTRESLQARYVEELRLWNGMLVQDAGDQARLRVVNGILVQEDAPADEAIQNTQFQDLWDTPPEARHDRMWDAPTVWRWRL